MLQSSSFSFFSTKLKIKAIFHYIKTPPKQLLMCRLYSETLVYSLSLDTAKILMGYKSSWRLFYEEFKEQAKKTVEEFLYLRIFMIIEPLCLEKTSETVESSLAPLCSSLNHDCKGHIDTSFEYFWGSDFNTSLDSLFQCCPPFLQRIFSQYPVFCTVLWFNVINTAIMLSLSPACRTWQISYLLHPKFLYSPEFKSAATTMIDINNQIPHASYKF